MRFISLLALFACFALPAQAQYTTNSKSATSTAKAQPAAQQRPAYQAARPTQAASTSSTAKPAAAQFRPRPTAQEDSEGASDLPSFEAFQKPAAQGSAVQNAAPAQRINPYAVRRQGSAQTQNAAAQGSVVPEIVWPKGEIWVYMSDFEWGDIDGAFVHCKWKIVLQNRTDTAIQNLKLEFVVRDSYNDPTFNNIQPRGAMVKKIMVYSNQCPAMKGVKPKIKVKSCTMGDIEGSDCSKYIVIK